MKITFNKLLSLFFIGLLIALFLSVTLHTHRISKDAAVYLLTANTHLKEMREMGIDSFSENIREDWVNVSSWHCKPLLEFVTTPILGMGLGETGVRIFFFFWLILGAGLMYYLFQRFIGKESALLATILFTFCGSMQINMTDLAPVSFFPVPFILVSVWCLARFYQEGCPRFLILASLGTGITFLAHPATPPFVIMMAISVIYYKAPLKNRLINLILFGVVSILPLLAMHLFTMIWYGSLEGFQYVDGTPMPYFQQIFDHADTVNKSYRLKASKMVVYRLLLKNGSLGVLLIFGTGIYALWSLFQIKGRIKERRGFDLETFSLIFFTLNFLFFLWTNPKERHLFQSLPFISLLTIQMLQHVLKKRALIGAVVVLYAVGGLLLVSNFAGFKMRYEKVDTFFTQNRLKKNVVTFDYRPMSYTVYGFKVFQILAPSSEKQNDEALYALVWDEMPLRPSFKEMGVEKVGGMKSETYYSHMAKKLYKIDPVFRFILYGAKKINPDLWKKLLFLHHNESFQVYRFKKRPAVIPVTRGYRYEILDRHYRSNI
ncbi:MAG: glycosyltransferase family 39 protein [Deltaproteobacteria bacterium]|nr:glycosyltransferase family 39 protein [Deltaproteobacteria bacterium]